MTDKELSHEQVEAALKEINQLAQDEYGISISELLESPLGQERLQRMAGVLLKKPFAKSHEPDSYNPTESKRQWRCCLNIFRCYMTTSLQ